MANDYSSKTILVIDDDHVNRRMIESRLKKQGFQTLVAGDGDEGLIILRQNKPDLIILDVEMPKMNGYTFMMMLKDMGRTYSRVPVVVLTAHADKQPIFQLRGVRGYLVKPVDFDVLFAKIDQCLFPVHRVINQYVFVVDSNETQCKLMEHFLTKAGFQNILFCSTGQDALDGLAAHRPAAVIIAKTLPDQPGEKLAEKIRSHADWDVSVFGLGDKGENVEETPQDSTVYNAVINRTPDYGSLIRELYNGIPMETV